MRHRSKDLRVGGTRRLRRDPPVEEGTVELSLSNQDNSGADFMPLLETLLPLSRHRF